MEIDNHPNCFILKVGSSAEGSAVEQFLLESLVTTLVGDNEVAQTAHAFLEANCGVDLCQSLLKKWNRLAQFLSYFDMIYYYETMKRVYGRPYHDL